MWVRGSLALAALFAVGCAGSPAPVAPAPVTSAPAAPIARLRVAVDGRGASAAIQSLSTVTLDASGSSGTGLRFGLDFGDGAGADQPVATHVYQDAGKTYKVRVIVTDALGRTDTAAAEIVVRNTEGTWSSGFYNENAKRFESRYLTVNVQAASSMSGVYTHPEGNRTSFSGELSVERGATIRLSDGTMTFATETDGGFNSDATKLTLHVHGGSADGLLLVFSRYSSY